MNIEHLRTIADQLGLLKTQVKAVAELLQEGATVPFIARYRKEATGSLDEVAITTIRDRLHRLAELDTRRSAILKSLEEHGHLTDVLAEKVRAAQTMAVLEDIYLPYRPKRRTRATIAREKGLEPLASTLFDQKGTDPEQVALDFIDPEKGIESTDDALAGARDIIAEMINENPVARERLRELYRHKALITSRMATDMEETGAKYRDYFDWAEPAIKSPSHRILAMRRGEKEDILNLTIAPPAQEAIDILTGLFVRTDAEDAAQVKLAINDGYKRLLSRAMETEMRLETKMRADQQAIAIFAENLRQLLLAPPLGARRVMGIDPGFRTGCKVVCLDRQGKLLHHDTIYPHTGQNGAREAAEKLLQMRRNYRIEAIAVGNGTAGRETETFVKDLPDSQNTPILLVNESGASVYSASEVARREFPDLDLTVRGAASIGRRLMDPLSELVKIDPKSIGVGQYQHDVDQTALKKSLDDVVISCVNAVGVDVNRASAELLCYVSGLGPRLGKNIVAHRDENGPYEDREHLKIVPRLGPKAFEQSAGFLRIPGGKNPLDASAVHPESYAIVDRMAAELKCNVSDLIQDTELRSRIDIQKYVTDTVGLPTLEDILQELAKPGRDPRQEFKTVEFTQGIESIGDLKTGMKLPGVVTNVTAFGAFVDIGVHQDGLVHISELSDRFVKDPSDVVSVRQQVNVSVLDVDIERNRISLSMKSEPGRKKDSRKKKPIRQAHGGQASGVKTRTRPKSSRPGPTQPKKTPFHNPFVEALRKK